MQFIDGGGQWAQVLRWHWQLVDLSPPCNMCESVRFRSHRYFYNADDVCGVYGVEIRRVGIRLRLRHLRHLSHFHLPNLHTSIDSWISIGLPGTTSISRPTVLGYRRNRQMRKDDGRVIDPHFPS